jgi:CIC family chloride channel protein
MPVTFCWDLGGYDVPNASADGGGRGSPGFRRAWAVPLVTTGGALVSAWFVARFAPEAEGHGTDSAIEAVHTDPRRRSPLVSDRC